MYIRKQNISSLCLFLSAHTTVWTQRRITMLLWELESWLIAGASVYVCMCVCMCVRLRV